MIVIGVADNQLREKLLLSDNLSLEIEIIKNRSSKRNHKEARNDTKLTEARNQTTIDALNTPRSRTKHQENQPSLTLNTNQCKYCSGSNQRGKYPTYGKNMLKIPQAKSLCCSLSVNITQSTLLKGRSIQLCKRDSRTCRTWIMKL